MQAKVALRARVNIDGFPTALLRFDAAPLSYRLKARTEV